jgi:hypothetical protein
MLRYCRKMSKKSVRKLYPEEGEEEDGFSCEL